MVHWLKRHDRNIFQPGRRKSFSMRMLRLDPAGIALGMIEEGRLEAKSGRDAKGNPVMTFKMAKPKRWWNRLFSSGRG
jgi:hypothetical protein